MGEGNVGGKEWAEANTLAVILSHQPFLFIRTAPLELQGKV